jgi:hypothetical protein
LVYPDLLLLARLLRHIIVINRTSCEPRFSVTCPEISGTGLVGSSPPNAAFIWYCNPLCRRTTLTICVLISSFSRLAFVNAHFMVTDFVAFDAYPTIP